jgi:hypothetical protein
MTTFAIIGLWPVWIMLGTLALLGGARHAVKRKRETAADREQAVISGIHSEQ